MNNKTPFRRIKLYELNNDGTWIDKGTGYLSIVFKEKLKDLKFVVHNEINNKIILSAKIIVSDIYQKQQETLIVWNDPESNLDIALSFQEPKGCDEIWQFLNALIEKNEPFDNDEFSLGEINFKNLPKIIEIINGVEMIEKEKFVNSIISKNAHLKLFTLFDKCEEMGKKDLEIFFIIFQKLILLNDIQLLDVLFSQECILRLMACLEYDPQVSIEKRVSHRNILSKKSIFKEVIPLENEELREKIHQTYRVQYLKDVVLARTIDDPTFQTLNSFIVFNQIEIINHLKCEGEYLKTVFNKAKSQDVQNEELYNILQFINELFSLSKTLQIAARNDFFDQILGYGVFEVLIITIGKGDNELLIKSLDIINITLTNDASFFRKYLCSQKQNNALLLKIVGAFNDVNCTPSLKGQISSILRQLIEPEIEFAYFNENYGTNNQTREEVIEIFYDKCFPEIIKPLSQSDEKSGIVETKHYIVELLNFCVKHHHQKIKLILLQEKLPSKVISLLNQEEKYIQLSSIRFLRALIGSKDAALIRHAIQYKLFHPLVETFKKNINKYNLVNSSILDIFHYIYKEKNTSLIIHLVDNFRDTFDKVDYIDLFKNFIKKYDNIKNQVDDSQSKTPVVETKVKREIEKDKEESWFDSDDSDNDQVISEKDKNKELKRYDSLTSYLAQQYMKDVQETENKNSLEFNVFNVDNNNNNNNDSNHIQESPKKMNISFNANHVKNEKKHKLEENQNNNKNENEINNNNNNNNNTPKKHKLEENHENNNSAKKTKLTNSEEEKK